MVKEDRDATPSATLAEEEDDWFDAIDEGEEFAFLASNLDSAENWSFSLATALFVCVCYASIVSSFSLEYLFRSVEWSPSWAIVFFLVWCYPRQMYNYATMGATSSFSLESSPVLPEHCFLSKSARDKWFIDSGASRHYCRTKGLFSDYTKVKGIKIRTSKKGHHMVAVGMGTIHTTVNNSPLILKKVLHVPELGSNLISVSKLRLILGSLASCLLRDE